MGQEIVWIDQLRQLVEEMPDNQDGYATKLQAKGQSRQIDLGMRAVKMTLPNDLWAKLTRTGGMTPEIRGWTERGGNSKYPFSGDLIVRIDPPGKKKVSNKKTRPLAAHSQAAPGQLVDRSQR